MCVTAADMFPGHSPRRRGRPACRFGLALGSALAGLLLTTASAADQMVTLPVIEDTYVHNLAPSSSYGSETGIASGHLISGNTLYLWKTFLKFDLTAVPDAMTVTAATLHMYQVNGTGFLSSGTNVLYVDDDTWSETTLTWNDGLAVGAVLGTCPDNKDHRDWSQWDLLSTGQWSPAADLSDNVLSLAVDEVGGSSSHNWISSNHQDPQAHPYLEVWYIPEPAAGAILGLVFALELLRRRGSAIR
jgi:hypothetical protein